MNYEDRERIEEYWAQDFDNRAKSCKELAIDWTNHPSWPSVYAANHILELTAQAELLKRLASDLRRPKWIRLESEEYERQNKERLSDSN